jgi:hypothetical protein
MPPTKAAGAVISPDDDAQEVDRLGGAISSSVTSAPHENQPIHAEAVRRRCRKCKGKLPDPTSNEREAFCTRGCYEQFYRKRCRVCECGIEQKGGQQRFICKKAECKSAWRQKVGFGRFLKAETLNPSRTSFAANISSEVPVPQRVLEPSKEGGRAQWRVIAGPALSANEFQAATVPDGPGLQLSWAGGEYQRIEARNRDRRHKHLENLAEKERERERQYLAMVRVGSGTLHRAVSGVSA